MKLCILVLALFAFLPGLHAQKMRLGQEPAKAKAGIAYPIKIHISGIHLRTDWNGATNEEVVYADAVLNGMKIELAGSWLWTRSTASAPLAVGDYTARLLKDTPDKSPLGREYELVFPDRTIWRGTVTGVSE